VTVTHTLSIIVLAVIAKVASVKWALSDDALHGYVGLVAGALILVVGLWMLVARLRGKEPLHFHSHDHDVLERGGHHHEHSHHGGDNFRFHSHEEGHSNDHDHSHKHEGHHIDLEPERKVGYWQLFLLGISGGLVPCPAAMALLLAGIGSGRVGEALWLVLLFSLGLAAALVAIGLAVVTASHFAGRFIDAKRFARKMAIASAGLITVIGMGTIFGSVRHIVSVPF